MTLGAENLMLACVSRYALCMLLYQLPYFATLTILNIFVGAPTGNPRGLLSAVVLIEIPPKLRGDAERG